MCSGAAQGLFDGVTTIKTLYKLADDEEENLPIAAQILRRDFYVDDVLTDAQTISEAIILRDQLISSLKKGGFCLRKWVVNHPSLIIEDQEHPDSAHMSLDPDSSIKTLGIRWNSPVKIISFTQTVLSQIAKLFDPLGLLGPSIMHAKIIMQLQWKARVVWDESIPVEIHSSWSAYLDHLPLIENLRFPRGITITDSVEVQLHGFCDASEKAYGACSKNLNLKMTIPHIYIYIRLISFKSRVALVKPLTLPRLKLCAAVLLARLYHTVKPTILTNIHESYLWSDSTIVLHWINTPAHRLKTFVSNRVSEIQTITESCHWQHVLSQDNPADLISRRQLPSDFVESSIWIDGPLWLTQESSAWPKGVLTPIDIPDLKPLIHNVKKPSSERKFGPLLSTELAISHNLIIRSVQFSCFKKEIESIKAGESLPSCSKLIPLNPIINEDDILRVGGRLAHSSSAEEQRHPILLPAQHHVTKLIIKAEHFRLKHAGMQATLYSVRQNYWPLNGRSVTRSFYLIRKCIPCFRVKPRLANHLMGTLPTQRVTSSRPFLRVRVDYCGPFYKKKKTSS
ncbi:GSCOCG00005816001-RA-CDS [Cotesia congregata]|nr:GSCOCG00005816001-RA-CDS [Cotesia congregata]